MKINPCKGCKDRSAECHAKCKKYAEWHTEYLAKKYKQNMERYPELYDYIVGKRYRGRNNDQR